MNTSMLRLIRGGLATLALVAGIGAAVAVGVHLHGRGPSSTVRGAVASASTPTPSPSSVTQVCLSTVQGIQTSDASGLTPATAKSSAIATARFVHPVTFNQASGDATFVRYTHVNADGKPAVDDPGTGTAMSNRPAWAVLFTGVHIPDPGGAGNAGPLPSNYTPPPSRVFTAWLVIVDDSTDKPLIGIGCSPTLVTPGS